MGGTDRKNLVARRGFFNEICPCGQVKYAARVKYAAQVKCSLRERGQISFHFAAKPQYGAVYEENRIAHADGAPSQLQRTARKPPETADLRALLFSDDRNVLGA